MVSGFKIDPDSVYDDGSLVLALGIASAALIRARRQGKLRFRRVGNRPLYMGRWIIDWLATDAVPTAEREAAHV